MNAHNLYTCDIYYCVPALSWGHDIILVGDGGKTFPKSFPQTIYFRKYACDLVLCIDYYWSMCGFSKNFNRLPPYFSKDNNSVGTLVSIGRLNPHQRAIVTDCL